MPIKKPRLATPDKLAKAERVMNRGRAKDFKRHPEMLARLASGEPRSATRAQIIEYRLATGRNRTSEARLTPGNWEVRNVPDGTGGNLVQFTGYACITCQDFDDDSAAYPIVDKYGEYLESVIQGAFRVTLQQNCDVAFLTNHGGPSLARTKSGTMKLAEHTTGATRGLYVEARLDRSNPAVQTVLSGIERGDLDEMSMSFRSIRDRWSDSADRRWLQEISLNQGDVAIVNFGANGATGGLVALDGKKPKKQPLPAWPGAFGNSETQSAQSLALSLIAANRVAEAGRR